MERYGDLGKVFSKEFMNFIIDPKGEDDTPLKEPASTISVTTDIDKVRTDFNEVMDLKENGLFRKILMYLNLR